MAYAEHIPEDWGPPAPTPEPGRPASPEMTPAVRGIAGFMAFLLGALSAACILIPRTAQGIAFGIWQGPLADPGGVVPVPWLSGWLAARVQAYVPGNALSLLNYQSSVPAVLACGMLASLVFRIMAPRFHWGVAFAAGLLAALLLAMNPVFHYTATAANPAPLTVFLVLASILVFLSGLGLEHRSMRPAVAGGLAGLAAANHPIFGLLLPVFALYLIAGTPQGIAITPRMLALILGFAICAILPLQFAMRSGETLRAFLGHALFTPYPAPGTWPPGVAFFTRLSVSMPWMVLLPAVAVLPVLLRPPVRMQATLLILLLVLFGPLLGSFSNQNLSVMNPYGPEAPELVVVALLTGLVAAGVLALLQGLSLLPRMRWVAVPVAVLLLLGNFGVFWPTVPARDDAWAEAFAGDLLSETAPEGTVVSGDPLLTSLLLAARAASATPASPVILPVRALVDPSGFGQKRLNALGLLPRHRFLDGHEQERWLRELNWFPTDGGEGDMAAINDLILWDYVSAKLDAGPFAFAGVSAFWLEMRGHRKGLTLHYPCADCRRPSDWTLASAPSKPVRDRDGLRTLSAALLPLSVNARRQADAETAREIAATLTASMPGNTGALRARLRAEARLGDEAAAIASMEEYLAAAPAKEGVADAFKSIIAEELARYRDEAAVRSYMNALAELPADPAQKNSVLDPLWAGEEFALLASAYEALQRTRVLDADVAYQLAAVRAQLGEWTRVTGSLERWQRVSGLSDAEAINALRKDGRFALYLRSLGLSAEPVSEL